MYCLCTWSVSLCGTTQKQTQESLNKLLKNVDDLPVTNNNINNLHLNPDITLKHTDYLYINKQVLKLIK